MKIFPFRNLNWNDLQKAGYEALAYMLNVPLKSMSDALQNQLTFPDNMLSLDVTTSFTHGVPTTVSTNGISVQPNFVIPGYAGGYVVAGCSITAFNSNNVAVTIYFAGAPTAPINVQIRLFP